MSGKEIPIRPGKRSSETSERSRASKTVDRSRVSHACEICREKRARCNGERPACQRCQKLRVECIYGLAKNDRRRKEVEDLKAQIEQYEGLLESMTPHLEPKLREKVEKLQQDIASSESPNLSQTYETSLVSMDIRNIPGNPFEGFTPLDHDGSQTSRRKSIASSLPLPSRHAPMIPVGAFTPPNFPTEQRSPHDEDYLDTKSQISSPPSLGKTVTDWQEGLLPRTKDATLPPRDVTQQAVKALDGYAIFFDFFEEHEMNELFQLVYESPSSPDRTVALVQVSIAAAVGCQYDSDRFSESTRKAYLMIVKIHLEDCIERDPLCAMRVMALLCMYFTFEKRISALMYVDTGLLIARAQKIDVLVPSAQSIKWKRIWCSLIFLSCWLSSSIGAYPDQACQYYHTSMFNYRNSATLPGDIIQLEMCKIAVLTARILRDVFHATTLSTGIIGIYKAELETWLFELPNFMRLDSLLAHGSISHHLRPVFLVHLLYLSTMTLIYRRILSEFADYPQSLIANTTMDDVKTHLDACLWSSRQGATILEVAISNCAAFRKCWMFIHATYCTCNILLYFAANKLLQNPTSETIDEDIIASEKCIRILDYCSKADESALQFYSNIRPLYEALAQIHSTYSPLSSPGGPHRNIPISTLINETKVSPPDVPSGGDILKIQQTVISAIEILLRPSDSNAQEDGLRRFLSNNSTEGAREPLTMYANMAGPYSSAGDFSKSAEESLQHYFWGDSVGQRRFTGGNSHNELYDGKAKAAISTNNSVFDQGSSGTGSASGSGSRGERVDL